MGVARIPTTDPHTAARGMAASGWERQALPPARGDVGAEREAATAVTSEAICLCDASGMVTLTNPAADALFGSRPPTTYRELIDRFEPAIAAPPGTATEPLELRPRDQPQRVVELRTYPVRTNPQATAPRPAGRIAVLRDVTGEHQARARREAFLGILSHELRTPITTIYAGTHLLAREGPTAPAARRELAQDVSAEAERLFRLVEDLLVLERADRGALDLALEPVLLHRTVSTTVRLEASRWPRITFAVRSPEDLQAVHGDATYVEQVIRNLLSNAARYGPAEGTVDVVIGSTPDEVSVRVLDRGGGVGPIEADELFGLFRRSPTTAGQAAGAGIGLFVCRQLVEAMKGRIWARPRDGGGSEFGFALRTYEETA
jgi:two-component system, OmpR family, sensor histidine kinase VicK